DRAAAASRAGAGEGGRAPARAQGWSAGARRRRVSRAPGAVPVRIRRGRRDRPALPPPGRDRNPVGGHDRPPVARGQDRDAPGPRQPEAGSDRDRRARRRDRPPPARAMALAEARVVKGLSKRRVAAVLGSAKFAYLAVETPSGPHVTPLLFASTPERLGFRIGRREAKAR